MWEKGYEHGDVNLSNLMFRRKEGKIVGVLVDWDLSAWRGSNQDEVIGGGDDHTGCIPFAALDVIDRRTPVHEYKHDLESMGWTLAYDCLDLNHPDNFDLIDAWHDFRRTGARRELFVGEMSRYRVRPGFEGPYSFAKMFLQWLVRDVAGRRGVSLFLPDPSNSVTSSLDQREHRKRPNWPQRIEDNWKQPSEAEIWATCSAMLQQTFFY